MQFAVCGIKAFVRAAFNSDAWQDYERKRRIKWCRRRDLGTGRAQDTGTIRGQPELAPI